MFLVTDTRANREDTIRKFLGRDPAIAVLLAAADFEWTVRRAILALGYRPNSIIRKESLHQCSGIDKDVWKNEVTPLRKNRLPAIVPNWGYFKTTAFPLRHKLIHGITSPPSRDYAEIRVEAVLAASASLVDYAAAFDVDLFARLPVRLKERPLP